MANKVLLPLVLRKEPFGGLIFDPTDATRVDLDFTGYKTLLRLLEKPLSLTAVEQNFITEVFANFAPSPHKTRRECRVIDGNIHDFSTYDFRVHSAPIIADFQITNICDQACPQCYVKATTKGMHVPLQDVKLVFDELKQVGVCQVALGGGEPLLHPHLEDILTEAVLRGIVPNLTTSGAVLSENLLQTLKSTCGAVALSLEAVGDRYSIRRKMGFERFRAAVKQLELHRINYVFQVTLGADNLADLPEITKYALTCKNLYGVIFLAYKPVGRGEYFGSPLSDVAYPTLRNALETAFNTLMPHTRVGYDCCIAPALTLLAGSETWKNKVLPVEGCSALRDSVGISCNLDVLPCTFTSEYIIGNLRNSPLREIWATGKANAFRNRLKGTGWRHESCRACSSFKQCFGGCPVMSLTPRCS